MNVKKLILLLKKMPQNLEVGVAMNDNSEHDVAGWVCSVIIDTDNGIDMSGKTLKTLGKNALF